MEAGRHRNRLEECPTELASLQHLLGRTSIRGEGPAADLPGVVRRVLASRPCVSLNRSAKGGKHLGKGIRGDQKNLQWKRMN